MLKQNKSQDFDLTLCRFLFDYRITKHCTTNESPAKILLGKEIKSRFNLLKPPVISDVIEQKQQNQIKNYRGNRNVKFAIGQKVYVRDYKNPNKDGWSPAKIKKQLGPRNYTCLLLRENRDIMRHVEQIRDGEAEVEGEDVLPLNLNDSQDGEQEHDATEPLNADEASIISINSSGDCEQFEDAVEPNVSIPDVTERPPRRACVSETNKKITEIASKEKRKR